MLIADACCNHLGDQRIIDRMIDLCSADVIKFQLYDVQELDYAWHNDYFYYKGCQLSDWNVENILEKCQAKKILPMFTCFTLSQLRRAHELGVENIKIASPSASNTELVSAAYNLGRVVISTGMSDKKEIHQLRTTYPRAVFLKCISRYPAVWKEEDKEDALGFDGISDHSCYIDTALWAIRQGLWVERHYTLGKDLPGKDHGISSLPSEIDALSREQEYLKKVERYKTRWQTQIVQK